MLNLKRISMYTQWWFHEGIEMSFVSLYSLIGVSVFFLTVQGKIFYRTRGFQANGNIIKNISSVALSEDCLHECYITEKCRSFNTFEMDKGRRYTCQLLSDDLCDIEKEKGISENTLASVYFSRKVEHCQNSSFVIFNWDKSRCLTTNETEEIRHVRKEEGCERFFKRGDNILKGDRCMIVEIDNVTKENVIRLSNSGACIEFIDVKNILTLKNADVDACLHFSTYLERIFKITKHCSNDVKLDNFSYNTAG